MSDTIIEKYAGYCPERQVERFIELHYKGKTTFPNGNSFSILVNVVCPSENNCQYLKEHDCPLLDKFRNQHSR